MWMQELQEIQKAQVSICGDVNAAVKYQGENSALPKWRDIAHIVVTIAKSGPDWKTPKHISIL